MISDGLFLCPHCGEKLNGKNGSFMCVNGHCFDKAKSGYVNLLPPNRKNSVSPGDNKEMIQSRVRVMNKGYYKPLAEAIGKIFAEFNPASVLDAGCGTGYLCGELKKSFPETEFIGTDISKFAIEQAAKKSKETAFAVCSSKRLPISSGSIDAVICAFAPVYEQEFSRVNSDNGLFLRVVPAKEHLFKLKEFLYDNPRYNEEEDEAFSLYEPLKVEYVKGEFGGDADDFNALVRMTPYYYHTSSDKLERLNKIDYSTVNTEFELRVFRKKADFQKN